MLHALKFAANTLEVSDSTQYIGKLLVFDRGTELVVLEATNYVSMTPANSLEASSNSILK